MCKCPFFIEEGDLQLAMCVCTQHVYTHIQSQKQSIAISTCIDCKKGHAGALSALLVMMVVVVVFRCGGMAKQRPNVNEDDKDEKDFLTFGYIEMCVSHACN